MKTIIKYGLVLLLSLLSPGLSAKPKQPLLLPDSTGRTDQLRLLCIGNSFSYFHESDLKLVRIAASQHRKMTVGHFFLGGLTFKRHLGIPDSHRAVDAGGYHFALLQEQSQRCAQYWRGEQPDEEDELTRLCQNILAKSPACVLILENTWSYEGKKKDFGGFASLEEFGECLEKGTAKLAQRVSQRLGRDILVSPIGQAFDLCRHQYPEIKIFGKDLKHQSPAGTYLKSCVNYALIFQAPLPGTADPCGLDPETARKLQEIANETVRPCRYGTKAFRRTRGVRPFGASALRPGSVARWENRDRPEILRFFETQVYGKMPGQAARVRYETVSGPVPALGGKALRKEVAIWLEGPEGRKMATPLLVLMYLPAAAKGPVPVFLGMNFKGNQQIGGDPGVTPSPTSPLLKDASGALQRGVQSSRWPLETILDRGYGLVTLYRGDVDPDFDDGFRGGVHPLFFREGQTCPAADEWGTVSAWAWGLQRVMDWLQEEPGVDAKHVAVFGHSRLGKTALWAAATDPRFALAISNDSGCTGAALSTRRQGETVEKINTTFPHWFCRNYTQYNGREKALYADQQGLIALIAPRPVYVASASEDAWADPEGEFQSAVRASPVWKLYGSGGLSSDRFPAAGQPVAGDRMGYHLRQGKHDITGYDWSRYLDFADRFLK